jgi:hypothetical protein
MAWDAATAEMLASSTNGPNPYAARAAWSWFSA